MAMSHVTDKSKPVRPFLSKRTSCRLTALRLWYFKRWLGLGDVTCQLGARIQQDANCISTTTKAKRRSSSKLPISKPRLGYVSSEFTNFQTRTWLPKKQTRGVEIKVAGFTTPENAGDG